MGKVTGVYLMPHPPIVISEVGRGEEEKIKNTADAMKKCGREIRDSKPGTIILITPHGSVFDDGVGILAEEALSGDFARFGASHVRFSFQNNLELTQSIITEAGERDILCVGIDKSLAEEYQVSTDLDWGALVPLYFVTQEYKDFRLVHISISLLPYEELYVFGTALQAAVEHHQEDVVIIASGDLSHRLREDGPYGFNPMGPKLDGTIIDILRSGNLEQLFEMDAQMVEEGGECGLRSIIMAAGALDEKTVQTEVLSYEGPFGVGYGVASIKPVQGENREGLRDRIFQSRAQQMGKVREKEDPYVQLARHTLESYITDGKTIEPSEDLPKTMLENQEGVFVSLKKQGQLRGCIGTIEPIQDSIAEEIIHNAISAGTRDPRFFPVEEDELKDLVYSVDILKPAEPIQTLEELDVKRYGVIVRSGSRSGLLLPNLEGVDTPKQQVEIALSKAGIHENEKYSMERFEVIRHH